MAYQSQYYKIIGSKTSFASKSLASKNEALFTDLSYEMTLQFTNNLFQTFLIDLEEKNGINITPSLNEISPNINYNKNTIRVNYKSETYFLIFQNNQDFIENVQNSNLLIEYLYDLTNLTIPENIILIFYMVDSISNLKIHKSKSAFTFFANTKLNIKIADITNSDDLVDFIYNFNNSIFTKENKSKITFYETKPVQTTALSENENIKNITFVKQLMCLPGLSERMAIGIVKVYPRLNDLYNVYLSNEYEEKEKENFLENIQVAGHSGGTKRLGPAMSNKIYKYFMAENPDTKLNE